MGHLQNKRCFLKILETLCSLHVSSWALCKWIIRFVSTGASVASSSPPSSVQVFCLSREKENIWTHQAAALPSPQLTGGTLFHPIEHHWCIDLCLCHCYGHYQESTQSEPKLDCFHIKFSSCSTAADAQCRKSAPARKQRVVRPPGHQNLPSMLHLLFYASSSPHQRAKGFTTKSQKWPSGGREAVPPQQRLEGSGGQLHPRCHPPKHGQAMLPTHPPASKSTCPERSPGSWSALKAGVLFYLSLLVAPVMG